METPTRKRTKIKRVEQAVIRALDNQDLWGDMEGIPETSQEELERLMAGGADSVCSSEELGITQAEDEKQFLFASYFGLPNSSKWPAEEKSLIHKIDQIVRHSAPKKIQVFLFVKDLKEGVAQEEYFSRDKIKEIKKSVTGKCPAITWQWLLLGNPKKDAKKLTDVKRYEMIQYPALDTAINLEAAKKEETPKTYMRALVFSVELYKLVQLYNEVGEQLFQNNVRFGLEDVMGVNRAIHDTLENAPEQFWFKNNGITILIKGRQSPCRKATELDLGVVNPDEDLPFSVVNGAQTITVAARFFYQLEYQKSKSENDKTELDRQARRKLKQAKEKALVLVRAIYLEENEIEQSKAISVALNRQKPIKVEDIAFINPAVHRLTQYLNACGAPEFQLARRGEIPTKGGRKLDLVSFARARTACLGNPGVARSAGAKKLLQTFEGKDEELRFSGNLFGEEWYQDRDDMESAFKRDFQAIAYASELAEKYDDVRPKRKEWPGEEAKPEERDRWIIIQNAKWYCVAALIYLFNGGQEKSGLPDFTKFKRPKGELDIRKIAEHMSALIELSIHAKNPKDAIDANTFKKKEAYDLLLCTLTKADNQLLNSQIKKELSALSDLLEIPLPLEADKEKETEAT